MEERHCFQKHRHGAAEGWPKAAQQKEAVGGRWKRTQTMRSMLEPPLRSSRRMMNSLAVDVISEMRFSSVLPACRTDELRFASDCPLFSLSVDRAMRAHPVHHHSGLHSVVNGLYSVA